MLPAIWSELARPAGLATMRAGIQLGEESKRFWTAATEDVKKMASKQFQEQVNTEQRVDTARTSLHAGLQLLFQPAAVGFITDLYFRLKPLFSSIEKYDEEGTGAYSTKLEALMDPDPRYDIIRKSLLQPARDAEHIVADAIYALNDIRHDGEAFESVAHQLLAIDAIEKTRSEDPPHGFMRAAFDTYLRCLSTEGHSYYLAYDEVLAVAEATEANVVITQQKDEQYCVIGQHFGNSESTVALLVMHGEKRGHFERLASMSEVQQRCTEREAARSAREEAERLAAEREHAEKKRKLAAEAEERKQRQRREEEEKKGRGTAS